MTSEVRREQPAPGTTVVREHKYRICNKCQFLIDDTGLCEDGCPNDAEHGPGTFFWAVYEVTKKYIRDEAGD